MSDLPKLTQKQQAFVMRYILNGFNASEAYRYAFNCEGSSPQVVNSEGSKLLKNPKVTPWIDKFMANSQQVIEEEFKYSIKDAFDELNDLQKRCKKSTTTYTVEKGCIDTKCKLAGLMTEKHQIFSTTLADVLDSLE